MGLFNIFIVVPQPLVATAMGSIIKAFFPDPPIWTMLAAARGNRRRCDAQGKGVD